MPTLSICIGVVPTILSSMNTLAPTGRETTNRTPVVRPALAGGEGAGREARSVGRARASATVTDGAGRLRLMVTRRSASR